MNSFINEHFLLHSETARRLYHDYAASLPIIDYHNHLSPPEIASDVNFPNLTEAWLKGDHYKWRAMRTAGTAEAYITGNDTSPKEKFLAWAKTVPLTLKNPLYHWTHLELKRFFDFSRLLNEDTAEEVWEMSKSLLQKPEFSTRNLLNKKNVHVICTTDDAIDTLEYHQQMQAEEFDDFMMFPTFRPDNAMKIEKPKIFMNYVKQLEKSANIDITDYASFIDALRNRHHYFDTMGCRASDHGISQLFAEPYTQNEIKQIFSGLLAGKKPDEKENRQFQSALMHEFATMDYEKGWAFQMHIGAMRNNNTKKFRELGPDTGFDSIGDFPLASSLSSFLDRLEQQNSLPKTIIYNLRSSDNELIASLIGAFMEEGVAGKIQHGAAWWFHDQKEGMEIQLQNLSNLGLLSHFIGMVTDSRSLLSFSRHEYFRRILCNMLGSDIEKGILPNEDNLLKDLIEKLCYTNALHYFTYPRLPEEAKLYS